MIFCKADLSVVSRLSLPDKLQINVGSIIIEDELAAERNCLSPGIACFSQARQH